MRDFPAAHSMDCLWFATDEEGHVAIFDTGECGDMPVSGFKIRGYEEEQLILAHLLRHHAKFDENIRDVIQEDFDELYRAIEETRHDDLIGPLLRSLGVFQYENPDYTCAPYHRVGGVPRPIRIDDLDEDFRKLLGQGRLGLRFSESTLVAAGEHTDTKGWRSAVWFDSEGRPHAIAGKEKKFRKLGEIPPLEKDVLEVSDGGYFYHGEKLYELVLKLVTEPHWSYD